MASIRGLKPGEFFAVLRSVNSSPLNTKKGNPLSLRNKKKETKNPDPWSGKIIRAFPPPPGQFYSGKRQRALSSAPSLKQAGPGIKKLSQPTPGERFNPMDGLPHLGLWFSF
ncbi:hypothetical protein JTE90_014941 [Oedothorax gibbosus]|uniref:Uncharacterized protein n=1 Tax=Oedothorax gibbosus TaxID=931172 RepID=A0AAV6TN27_9ARAC|nr:hypothetical protein JTE90_014941 [Oedothorax gibbosus]